MMSIINLAESYAYLSVLSEGFAGTSPIGLLGAGDIKAMKVYPGAGEAGSYTAYSGTDAISLADMVSTPDVAFATLQSNFESNWQAMAIQSLGIKLTFKFGKKLLRGPIANVNRTVFKEIGMGVKL